MSQAGPALHFRLATPDDAPAMYPLIYAAYRGDGTGFGWTSEMDLVRGRRIDEPGLLAKITAADGAVLLAVAVDETTTQPPESAAAILGCCEVSRRPGRTAYFGLFAVSPRWQNAGIGRRLLAHAEEYCQRTWGAERIEMSVLCGRDELVRWYLRRGYRRVGGPYPFPMEELEKMGCASLVGKLMYEVFAKDLTGLVVGDSARVESDAVLG